MKLNMLISGSFFFQAEDGIRDLTVTGVQTCALPISWQKEELLKAVEADTCFYVSNAARVIGKDEIDISVDPPPDVMVEVDKANQSLNKFSIYAAFGGPEIWRCDVRRNRIQILELRGSVYVEVPSSRAFPVLTGAILVDFIARSRTDGQMAVLSAFRHWIQSVKSV